MFKEELIQVVHEPLPDKESVIRYISKMAHENELIDNEESYTQAVFDREAEVSTAVGHQVAIPHGESDAVRETFVSCLKLDQPIRWDDNETINLVFMIGVPLAVRQKEHIRILAALSRHLMREEFRLQLQDAHTTEEFYQTIKTIEEEK